MLMTSSFLPTAAAPATSSSSSSSSFSSHQQVLPPGRFLCIFSAGVVLGCLLLPSLLLLLAAHSQRPIRIRVVRMHLPTHHASGIINFVSPRHAAAPAATAASSGGDGGGVFNADNATANSDGNLTSSSDISGSSSGGINGDGAANPSEVSGSISPSLLGEISAEDVQLAAAAAAADGEGDSGSIWDLLPLHEAARRSGASHLQLLTAGISSLPLLSVDRWQQAKTALLVSLPQEDTDTASFLLSQPLFEFSQEFARSRHAWPSVGRGWRTAGVFPLGSKVRKLGVKEAVESCLKLRKHIGVQLERLQAAEQRRSEAELSSTVEYPEGQREGRGREARNLRQKPKRKPEKRAKKRPGQPKRRPEKATRRSKPSSRVPILLPPPSLSGMRVAPPAASLPAPSAASLPAPSAASLPASSDEAHDMAMSRWGQHCHEQLAIDDWQMDGFVGIKPKWAVSKGQQGEEAEGKEGEEGEKESSSSSSANESAEDPQNNVTSFTSVAEVVQTSAPSSPTRRRSQLQEPLYWWRREWKASYSSRQRNMSFILSYSDSPNTIDIVTNRFVSYSAFPDSFSDDSSWELIINVAEPSSWPQWLERWRQAAKRGLFLVIFQHKVHETRAYNSAMRVARAPFATLLRDARDPGEDELWMEHLMRVFLVHSKATLVGVGWGSLGLGGGGHQPNSAELYRENFRPELFPMEDASTRQRCHMAAELDFAPLSFRKHRVLRMGGLDQGWSARRELGNLTNWQLSARSWLAGFQNFHLFSIHDAFYHSLHDRASQSFSPEESREVDGRAFLNEVVVPYGEQVNRWLFHENDRFQFVENGQEW